MDIQWLAQEAKQVHDIFAGLFYSLVLCLVLLGVVINFFKFPMGEVPEFFHLAGRAIIAAFLLVAFPEIMNTLSDITDQLSKDIGQLNNFNLVLHRLGEKIGDLTWSWVSFKDSLLLLISYATFFILYITVYFADAMFLMTWTLLYVFSPVLIAAFTLPSTSKATTGLFQSLIEVCLWKICWSVLATLLWSFALSQINKPEYDVDFLTAILLNIMLALSVLITPIVVRSLLKGGVHSTASLAGGAILSVASLTPTGAVGAAAAGIASGAKGITSPKDDGVEREIPRS